MFIIGILIYGYGFHNVDLAFNAEYGAIDVNAYGYLQNRETMHLNGLRMLSIGIIFPILALVSLYLRGGVYGTKKD